MGIDTRNESISESWQSSVLEPRPASLLPPIALILNIPPPPKANAKEVHEVPIAKLHENSGTQLDAELLAIWKRKWSHDKSTRRQLGDRPSAAAGLVRPGPLYDMYGPGYDANPVPDELLRASEELLRFLYFQWRPHFDSDIGIGPDSELGSNSSIADDVFSTHRKHERSDLERRGFAFIEEIITKAHEELSRRHRAQLLRREQVRLVRPTFQFVMDGLKRWMRQSPDLTYEANKNELRCIARLFRRTLRFMTEIRSDRLEALLLRYIVELDGTGAYEHVVESIRSETLACWNLEHGGADFQASGEWHTLTGLTRRERVWMSLYFGENFDHLKPEVERLEKERHYESIST
ncbi:hypothetical protein BJ508DRAFT_359851 [Ascobolus immersus RN42]|uniref:Uncharacterized protein n=1 Tax=Ascobolus immersus RN42 TaxID=1160509 RepID=A0A3N4IJ15_ASCIM|nr:hypothetical protein BJ508DRAFT_359851 [Ascobolus immersus RN42]